MATENDELRHRATKTEKSDDNSGETSPDPSRTGGRDVGNSSGDRNVFQYPSSGPYRTAAEYSQAVQTWLWQYQMWNQMNCFCMFMPMLNYGLMQQQQQFNSGVPATSPDSFYPSAASGQRLPPAQAATSPNAAANQQSAAQNINQNREVEFKIPPLWKRVFAEFIDFFLLFIVKLGVTIFFVEYIGLVDLRHYDLEYLLTADMDYNTAFAMTSELVAMEIINRVFICIFETLCLRKGLAGTVGGTTPGKRMMGLKIVSCREVLDIPGNRVRINPAGNIGTWNAFVRSVIKNFSLAFFFPVCLTVFFFQHNRAAYDIISNCIVVESTNLPGRRR